MRDFLRCDGEFVGAEVVGDVFAYCVLVVADGFDLDDVAVKGEEGRFRDDGVEVGGVNRVV